LAQTEAALVEVQSVLDDLVIPAPATGMITTRVVDNGEMVSAGSPLFDIVDLDKLYLKVYVPEKEIGKVRLGLPAQIYTDAFPDMPFSATLRYIASQAEFTPKEVQTPDERVKLVYAVKLYLDKNPEHKLTPGLPADAVIRWQEATPWAKPRW
jgi:HlyD family secretion protein